MSRLARLRFRKPLVFAMAVPLLVAGAVIGTVSTASANTPQLTARAACDGVVSFTATAGNPPGTTDAMRASANVDVRYSTDGTTFTSVRGAAANTPDGDKYTFTTGNDFTFDDSFTLPASVQRPGIVRLRVIANGTQDAQMPVALPGACGAPSASVIPPSCSVASAQVTLSNSAQLPVAFRLFLDAATTPFQTVTVNSGTKNVMVPQGLAALISVQAENMAVLHADVAPAANCDPNDPAATVTPTNPTASDVVTTTTAPTTTTSSSTTTVATAPVGLQAGCIADASGWSVTFDNSKGTSPVDYVVRDSLGVNLDSTVVAAGASLTKTYPFSVTAGSSVSVYGNGDFIATGPSKVECVDSGATIDTQCNTAAGNGVVLGFTDTGKVDETFTVLRDGKEVVGSPFTVEPSDLVTQKLLPLNNGEKTTIRVTGNSGFAFEKTVTLTCPPSKSSTSVLGKTISRDNLPFTGIDVRAQMTLATVLVAIGAALLYASVDFGLTGRYEGVKSMTSQLRIPFNVSAKPLAIRDWFGDLVAPKGKHYRRR